MIGIPHISLPEAVGAFADLMFDDPLYNWDPTTNGGRPFCRSHFYSRREFLETPIYREVYRPLGIDNHCAVYVPTKPEEVMFFGIERNGGPDFSGDEMALLGLAQAQLANAHRLARLMEDSAEGKLDRNLLIAAGLTPREAETLFWMNHGKSNREMALLLMASIHTVKDHVTSIFNKIGAGNRLAAVAWARWTCRNLAFENRETVFLVNVDARVS